MPKMRITRTIGGIYGVKIGGGALLASCTDDNPDLAWGSCSPGEERFITITRDGTGSTLSAIQFSGDTDSFEISSIDGVSVGPFACTTYPNLDVALGDLGSLLYGEEAVIGIRTAFDDGSAASMNIEIVDANGSTVATRTATATVQDPFLALCETHGDLLYVYGARDLPTGDLAGDGALVFEDLSSVGAPDIIYKKYSGESVLWRTIEGDPCGVSSALSKCSDSDYRAGYNHPTAYQYAIAAASNGAAKTFLVFLQFFNAMLTCIPNADWVSFGGYVGAEFPPNAANPRPRTITPYMYTSANVSIGLGGQQNTGNDVLFATGKWYCIAHADTDTNAFKYAYTEVGQSWGSMQPWSSDNHGGLIGYTSGLQMGYMTNHVNSRNQDGVRVAGIVGFSGIKSEAQLQALYEAAAGI